MYILQKRDIFYTLLSITRIFSLADRVFYNHLIHSLFDIVHLAMLGHSMLIKWYTMISLCLNLIQNGFWGVSKFEGVHDSLLGLDKIVKSSLQKEIYLLAKWDNDAEKVSYNLENYSEESLTGLETIRKIILRGVEALQSRGEEFLARPVFSEEEKLRRYRTRA